MLTMECQIRKKAAGSELDDTFLKMTTFLDKQMLFDFRKSCHSKKCVRFTKSVHSIQKTAFNLLKVFNRKNCSFAESVHLQKLFICKNCLF